MSGMEEGLKLSHTATMGDEGMVFVYESPWSTEIAHQHLTIGAGDAFVYRPGVGGGRLHTMEKLAVEKNHTRARTRN